MHAHISLLGLSYNLFSPSSINHGCEAHHHHHHHNSFHFNATSPLHHSHCQRSMRFSTRRRRLRHHHDSHLRQLLAFQELLNLVGEHHHRHGLQGPRKSRVLVQPRRLIEEKAHFRSPNRFGPSLRDWQLRGPSETGFAEPTIFYGSGYQHR